MASDGKRMLFGVGVEEAEEMGPTPPGEARIVLGEDEFREVAVLSNGTAIYREPNEVGGHRYWSDAVGGGVAIWDTCITSEEELLAAIACEIQRTRDES